MISHRLTLSSQIALELATKILTAVVQLLGDIDVYALLKPVVEIIEVMVRMLIEVIQALISTAMGILQALSKIIGALLTVTIAVVKILFPMIKWYVGLVFKLLFPVLKVVIAIVSWFLNLVTMARSLNRSLLEYDLSVEGMEKRFLAASNFAEQYHNDPSGFRRKLASLDDADMEGGAFSQGYSQLHQTMYSSAGWAGMRHWSDATTNNAADLEIRTMVGILDDTPIHSFGWYWSVNRPYLQGIADGSFPTEVYVGESVLSSDQRYVDPSMAKFVPYDKQSAGRALLAFAGERELLSLEEEQALTKTEAVTHNEYWKKYSTTDGNEDIIAWYSHEHNKHHQLRQEASAKLKKRVAGLQFDSADDYYAHYNNGQQSAKPALTYEEFKSLQEDLTTTRPKKRPFADDLDGRHECKRLACGGRGKTLPHAVHSLRRLSQRRQEKEHVSYKPAGMSEEDYQKGRVVHGHVLGHAVNEGLDVLRWHLENPMLHEQVSRSWKRLTGHKNIGDALDEYHRHYADPGEWMYERIGSLSDWTPFRWLAEKDPDFDTRPWFGDWARREIGILDKPPTGYHTRKLNALGDDMSQHRHLLEMEMPEGATKFREWQWARPRNGIATAVEQAELDSSRPEDAVLEAYRKRWEEAEMSPVDGRHLFALPFPLPDVPDVYQQIDDGKARTDSFKSGKPQPKATLPLFQLLTQTDCYTSHPRNPLCLPTVPENWQINSIPTIVWPPNATQDDSFCAPTFKLVKRDLTAWQTYISFRWYYNGLQIPRLILSSIPIFTDTIYQLTQTFPFLTWLLKIPLALPPGHTPDALDWICAFIYGPYALWLWYATFKILSLLFPIFLAIIEGIVGGFALNTQFVGENAAYYAASAERDEIAIHQASRDSPANPSLNMPGNAYGDRNYFYRGASGGMPNALPYHGGDKNNLWVGNRDAAVASGHGPGRGFDSPLDPGAARNPMYAMGQHSPYTFNAEDGSQTYNGVPPSFAVPGVRDASNDIDRQSQSSSAEQLPALSPKEAEDLRRRKMQQNQLLQRLRVAVAAGVMEFGVPNLDVPESEKNPHQVTVFRRFWDWFTDDRVTFDDIWKFEQRNRPLLLSFQESILWWWQARNLSRRRWVERHTMSPAQGMLMRNFLPHASERKQSPPSSLSSVVVTQT